MEVSPSVRDRLEATEDVRKRIGILTGLLIRQAADLSRSGWAKHMTVRATILRELTGSEAPDEDDLEELLDELLAFHGWTEVVSDSLLEMLPVRRTCERLLDVIIKGLYEGMREAEMLE